MGSPEFFASYNEAIQDRQGPDTNRFKSVVISYKASQDYKKLAESTRKNWGPWLDKRAKERAKMESAGLHFHDLRGTAATASISRGSKFE